MAQSTTIIKWLGNDLVYKELEICLNTKVESERSLDWVPFGFDKLSELTNSFIGLVHFVDIIS